MDHKNGTGYGVKGFAVKNADADHDNNYVLLLNIPLTEALRQVLTETGLAGCVANNPSDDQHIDKEHATGNPVDDKHARIGGIGWSVYMGKNYGMFGLCALSTAINRLFYHATAIRQFIIDKFASHALFIYLDQQSAIQQLIYPLAGELHIPQYQEFNWEEFSPDQEVAYYLQQLSQLVKTGISNSLIP